MSRLLLLVAIVAVIYLLIRSFRKRMPEKEAAAVEDMVRCAHCGVHLPKGEALRSDGHFFCGAEHRNAYHQ